MLLRSSCGLEDREDNYLPCMLLHEQDCYRMNKTVYRMNKTAYRMNKTKNKYPPRQRDANRPARLRVGLVLRLESLPEALYRRDAHHDHDGAHRHGSDDPPVQHPRLLRSAGTHQSTEGAPQTCTHSERKKEGTGQRINAREVTEGNGR